MTYDFLSSVNYLNNGKSEPLLTFCLFRWLRWTAFVFADILLKFPLFSRMLQGKEADHALCLHQFDDKETRTKILKQEIIVIRSGHSSRNLCTVNINGLRNVHWRVIKHSDCQTNAIIPLVFITINDDNNKRKLKDEIKGCNCSACQTYESDQLAPHPKASCYFRHGTRTWLTTHCHFCMTILVEAEQNILKGEMHCWRLWFS